MTDKTRLFEVTEFDIIVLGAGSAGFSAAITASQAGKSVALVGYGTVGGTCVNVGCVPSKALIRAAESMHSQRVSARFDGIDVRAHLTSYTASAEQRDALVRQLREKKYVELLPEYENITYFEASSPVLLGNKAIELDGRILRAPKFIIATGARPHIPDLDGLQDVQYLDSTSLLALHELPEDLLFIGGGYISVELAQAFARMGSNVTILARSGLLPRTEPEIAETVTQHLIDEGIEVITGAAVSAKQDPVGPVVVSYETGDGPQEITTQHLVVATGRTPNVESLGLGHHGVKTSRNGSIAVNDAMQSNVDWVYAVGDVTGENQFVYMAALEGRIGASHALDLPTKPKSGTIVPWVVFCEPQVAGVGLTEKQAKDAGYDVVTSVLPMSEVPRALAAHDITGLVKLVADKTSKTILGGQVMGPEAGDVIQTLAMSLASGHSYTDLADMVFPYLTTVESLKLTAQAFTQDVSKLSCCAG